MQLSHISPLFISTHTPQQSPHCITSLQTNLVPIKGFAHEVLHQLCTSGRVLQMALCYLEAICAKVPKVVRKEKMGLGVQVKSLCHMWHPQDTPHSWHCYVLLWLLCTQTSNFHVWLLNWQNHHSTITICNYNPRICPQHNHLTSPLC
jgi:hypothetical protein